MSEYQGIIDDLKDPTRDLRRAIPEQWRGFTDLHTAAITDGALPSRIKELIALAIAVSQRCDGCIAYHAQATARRGASAQEVAETLGVALLMGGGPVSVYAPRAWDAYREFAASMPEHQVA
jgi:AhpD family alkylhydroperoxidase